MIATGGLSIPTLGASGFGYQIARQFGHNVLPTRAGLVPFTITEPQLKTLCSELSGTSVEDCLVSCNGQSFRENILFTHRGLSGPAILQISSYWHPGDVVHIDLLPHLDLVEWLTAQRQERPNIELKTLLGEVFTRKMAGLLCEQWFSSRPLKQYGPSELEAIANKLADWQVVPAGTEGYRTAEVTLGGVDTREVSSKTMESQKAPGLYFVGEVLDVTGHLGGFNFNGPGRRATRPDGSSSRRSARNRYSLVRLDGGEISRGPAGSVAVFWYSCWLRLLLSSADSSSSGEQPTSARAASAPAKIKLDFIAFLLRMTP